MPEIEATLLPESELPISFVQRECNWLQALEGDIDTSHFGFLHAGSVQPEHVPTGQLPDRYTVTNRAPEYHVTDTDWGTMYCAYRPAEDGPDLLALRQFPVPVLDADPAGRLHRSRQQPRLGPDGRHPHDVRQPHAGSRPPPSIGPLTGRQPMPGFAAGASISAEHAPTGTAAGGWRSNASERLADRPRGAGDAAAITPASTASMAQDQAMTESMGPDHRPRCSSTWRRATR